MFSVVLWATVLWATAGLPGTRIAPHGMARGPALARREAPSLSSLSRRALLGGSLACPCCFLPQSADALAALVTPPNARDASAYDVPRDSRRDSGFACGMANGMGDYEAAVAGRKRELFDRLLARLPRSDAVVVELGMGSFPNAQFLAAAPTGSAAAPQRMDIIGIDPNDSMEAYALRSAKRAGLIEQGHSLRVKHGVGEALPLKDRSTDAVVCTLTLCSVLDPDKVPGAFTPPFTPAIHTSAPCSNPPTCAALVLFTSSTHACPSDLLTPRLPFHTRNSLLPIHARNRPSSAAGARRSATGVAPGWRLPLPRARPLRDGLPPRQAAAPRDADAGVQRIQNIHI